MNAALAEGSSDGKYKKVINDRDGVVEDAFTKSRRDLNDNWFGIHEQQIKTLPDGSIRTTPNFRHTDVTTEDVAP